MNSSIISILNYIAISTQIDYQNFYQDLDLCIKVSPICEEVLVLQKTSSRWMHWLMGSAPVIFHVVTGSRTHSTRLYGPKQCFLPNVVLGTFLESFGFVPRVKDLFLSVPALTTSAMRSPSRAQQNFCPLVTSFWRARSLSVRIGRVTSSRLSAR